MHGLKRFILKISPRPIKNLYYDIKSKRGATTTQEVFDSIKEENKWGSTESLSGPGSEISQTRNLEAELPKIFNSFGIKNILDIPCGDFNWMKKVILPYVENHEFSYVGADIVDTLTRENEEKYGIEHIKFLTLNIISDKLPKVDLVFVRDCFVHLPYKDIQKALQNIKESGSKYLMSTTFINHHDNHNIPTGHWRPINLQEAPFNFKKPAYTLIEGCTEAGGKYKDKAMGLWLMEDF